ncbi:hypothetical protein FQA47_015566, partial [Oryzias melastigma]
FRLCPASFTHVPVLRAAASSSLLRMREGGFAIPSSPSRSFPVRPLWYPEEPHAVGPACPRERRSRVRVCSTSPPGLHRTQRHAVLFAVLKLGTLL